MKRLAPLFLLLVTTTVNAMPPALSEVVSRIAARTAAQLKSIVVTDLDETVIDTTLRRHSSLRQATLELCGTSRDGDCGRAFGLTAAELFALPNHYDLGPAYDRAGIPVGEFRAKLDKRAVDIYLSGAYTEQDQPMPGAYEYVRALKAAGAWVFFVSSRFQDVQGAPTITSLIALGMLDPQDADQVILRERGQSSIDFKKQAFERIAEIGCNWFASVELVMENEPENLNAMALTFPRAPAVFVEGAFLKPLPLQAPGAIRIRDFR